MDESGAREWQREVGEWSSSEINLGCLASSNESSSILNVFGDIYQTFSVIFLFKLLIFCTKLMCGAHLPGMKA